MSSSMTPSAPLSTSASTSASSWPAWAREPLLHFVVLGGLLFGIDHYLVSRTDDPNTIVMGAEVDKEARDTFKAARGREPDAKELQALRNVWLDNEVLYREGLSLQVDKGDTAIRERVIFKALSVVDANTKPPKVDEKSLKAWFEARRVKYDEPPRYDFQEAVLAGENNEVNLRAFVTALNGGNPGEANAGLRVFKGRPLSNLDQSYGPEFAKALALAPAQEWRAYQTKSGWHAIRLEALTPGKAADFNAIKTVVYQDWLDATMAEQRSAAVRALQKKYKIRIEEAAK
jgi:hypothetical protein